jgi:hypothetical protein
MILLRLRTNAFFIILLAYTKLLVGVGQTKNGTTNIFEIIDLKDSNFRCQNFPPLPGVSVINYFSLLIMGNQTKLVCFSLANIWVKPWRKCIH